METKNKICFVISPIGKPNSETRKHSDSVLKNIIRPVLKKEYEIIRSDKISRVGNITSQIITKLKSHKRHTEDRYAFRLSKKPHFRVTFSTDCSPRRLPWA